MALVGYIFQRQQQRHITHIIAPITKNIKNVSKSIYFGKIEMLFIHKYKNVFTTSFCHDCECMYSALYVQ